LTGFENQKIIIIFYVILTTYPQPDDQILSWLELFAAP